MSIEPENLQLLHKGSRLMPVCFVEENWLYRYTSTSISFCIQSRVDQEKHGFLFSYGILIDRPWPKDPVEGAMEIVATMNLDRFEVRFGKRKIFIRSPESVNIDVFIDQHYVLFVASFA